MELKKVYKELERAERKKKEEKLRKIEIEQDRMFRETSMKRLLNISKKEEYLKNILGRSIYSNHFENNKLDPVKSNFKLINNIPKNYIQIKENNKYVQNEINDKLPIIQESSKLQGFPKIDNKRAQTEENKHIYLIKNKKRIINSFSELKINKKLDKIINLKEKPKIEINYNINFKSSINFFKRKYTLPKLEMQTIALSLAIQAKEFFSKILIFIIFFSFISIIIYHKKYIIYNYF